jgi:hypothetical protein
MADLLELPIDQVVGRSSQANSQALSVSRGHGIVPSGIGSLPEDLLLQIRFETLARRWKKETAHLSSVTKTAMHPAYQAIIGMGPKALPLIFADLHAHGGHWFWALHAITQEDPARGCEDFATATQRWLEWAEAQGFLS